MQAKDLFIDAEEREVASLTSGSIGVGNVLKKEYCVISDKRLYHNGVAYAVGGGATRGTRQDIIELENINGTSIGTIGDMKLLIFGILTAIIGIGIIMLIMYFAKRIRYMQIHHPGGSMIMEYKWCKMDTLREFDKQIHLAVDKARKERTETLA